MLRVFVGVLIVLSAANPARAEWSSRSFYTLLHRVALLWVSFVASLLVPSGPAHALFGFVPAEYSPDVLVKQVEECHDNVCQNCLYAAYPLQPKPFDRVGATPRL